MIIKRALNRAYLLLLIVIGLLLLTSCVKNADDINDEFTFVFFGDIQEIEDSRYVVFRSLLKSAFNQNVNPEFILLAGDVVDDGNDEKQWQDFIDVMEDETSNIDFYACVGNHDDTELQKKYFDISKYDYIEGNNSFYSFDYKNVHFTIMDSNLMGLPSVESIEWLENDLESTRAKYKIVMFHHPAYVANSIPKDMIRAKTILDTYIPIMEKYNVDLVLNGHQHLYMRTHPIKNGSISKDGIVYIVGNSSSKHYSSSKYDYIAISKDDIPVYSLITIKNDGIFVQSKDEEGNIIDKFYVSGEDEEK